MYTKNKFTPNSEFANDVTTKTDSLDYYYLKVKELSTKTVIPLDARYHLRNEKTFEKEYFESIRLLYDALAYFEKVNATDQKVVTYLKLAEIYKKIRNFNLSKETDAILMNQYLEQPISKSLKAQILINNAQYNGFTGKTKEAIQRLGSLNIQDFAADKMVLRKYYKVLMRRYLNMNNYDAVRTSLEKLHNIKAAAQPEDEAIKYLYLAMIACQEDDYKEALKLINKAKASTALQYVEQFEMIKFHKMEHLVNEALGNYKEALSGFKKYNDVRNSVKSFNLNVSATILNFKLKRDKKIKALEEESRMNALMADQKKKFYILSTLFVSVAVSLLIFLIILYKRKKNRLKLQYENEKMKEIAAIKNNFIENLSHEIRTPITITTGYLSMITNTMDYGKIKKYADLTIRNNGQVIQMLNNFLTLLKLDKKPTESKQTVEKMEAFLREQVHAFQGVAEIKGVHIYYKSNIKSNQNITFPYDDLRKIINNIMSNALKYTSPTYGIYVHTFIDKSGLNIIIKDEGIGIDKEEQQLIFDRFYQTKNNLTNGGFGIGLSLVYELIKKLKGTITLDSEKNVGSVFTIQLPLAMENPLLYIDEKTQDFQNISQLEIVTTDNETNLPEILIVDDNIEMIGYLKDLLEPFLSCTVAFDGAQALAFAKKKQYDLILSDLRMPLMDGHKLKLELDKLGNYEATPFIIITASPEDYLEHQKEKYGVYDYLIKPFDSAELITRINFHLEKDIYKRQLQSIENESITFNGAYAEFMEKINTIILENLTNKEFTIHQLAQECGYSHKQFAQIVQQKSGMTPVKVILEIRLQKAYELIVKNNYNSINEILYAVGLNSRSYFNKVFVKRFGLNPGELIRKYQAQDKFS
ncbi:ATP-binding protein [Kordia sp. SMS9]|uniref:ATP-binding protein n=1 Tax=Kordia sp. SMS9 TaxID=2282170 RepID=UPI0013B38912|nr:ATP-binding protein [Kordia sp. SMS9]